MTEEQRKLYDEAIREARKAQNKEWKHDTRKNLMRSATKYEWKVYKALPEWLRRNATRQRAFQHLGHTYFFDIYIPCAKVAIEVDGGYHITRKGKDQLRDLIASLYGIKTFRITNEDVMRPNELRFFLLVVEQYCLQRKA